MVTRTILYVVTCGLLMAGCTFIGDPEGVKTFRVSPENVSRVMAEVSAFTMSSDAAGIKRVEVLFASGFYGTGEGWKLGSAAGGREGLEVIYRSEDREHPAVISGGRRITGWKVGSDGVWRVTLPDVAAGKWNFAQLYVNGVRRFTPRIPETGFLTTVSNAFLDAKANRVGGFTFKAGDLDKVRANLADTEVQVLHTWAVTRERIAEIDTWTNVLRFKKSRESGNFSASDFTARRYRVENVKEAFGKPGEWYLDRPTGELAYTPLSGETLENTEVIAPEAVNVLTLLGDEGRPMKHVTFRDLTFAHQNWVTPDAGSFAAQSAFNLPSMVVLGRAEDVTFERCGFYHTGGYAIGFGPCVSACRVQSCLMRDLGGGGIRIGPFSGYGTYPFLSEAEQKHVPTIAGFGGPLKDLTHHITVENCRITEGGRIFPAAVGILIGRSSYNRLVHNEIDHFYYTGISCGWNWDSQKPSNAHDNEIAYNHIYEIGQKLLSDMGLIYLLGRAPGTTVHDNNLHDIRTYAYGGTGIYPDEGSSELKIYNNLVRNSVRSYHQNYGYENEVFNNIFVNGREVQYDYRPEANSTDVSLCLHHNVFVWKTGIFMVRNAPFGMKHDKYKAWIAKTGPFGGLSSASNLLYNAAAPGKTIFHRKYDLAAWQKISKQDVGTVEADPLLRDVWSGDVTIGAASPLVALGFKPIYPEKAGLSDVTDLPPFPTWEAATPFADVAQ